MKDKKIKENIPDRNKFNEVKLAIIYKISSIKYVGDLSDIGNEIGFVVGDYISEDVGYEKNAFFHGINHGISLKDGTHCQLHP